MKPEVSEWRLPLLLFAFEAPTADSPKEQPEAAPEEPKPDEPQEKNSDG